MKLIFKVAYKINNAFQIQTHFTNRQDLNFIFLKYFDFFQRPSEYYCAEVKI